MSTPGLHADLPDGLPRPGDVLDGKCRIDGVLGVGGMGAVLAATHLHLDQPVALKIMRPELARDREVVERFLREGRAAVRIRSPHVAKVLDVATAPNGEPYMIMERLEGEDLAKLLERSGPMPIHAAVGYLLEACDALAEAHEKKIVHRDLKPSNMFVAHQEDGSTLLKVLDFGISKLVHEDDALGITKSRSILGSPLYMSPEQLKASKSVDARSDIWSLGVILHELIAGRPPFDAGTVAELGALVLTGEPPPLDRAAPGVPPGLAAIARRCMAREPEGRFATVPALVAALAPFAPPSHHHLVERITKRAGQAPGSDPSLPAQPPSSSELADTHVAPPPAMTRTNGAWTTGRTTAPNPAATILFVVAGLVVLGAIGGGAFFLRARLAKPAVATAPSTAPTASESRDTPTTAPTSEPEPPVTAASGTPSDPTVAASSAPTTSARSKPAAPTTKAAGTGSRPAPAKSAAAPAASAPPRSDRFE
ncbi:MAG: protein kinase [Deltaproteobacteria bacterium]|nr:protein kinase [Deltaproteobacteria bacterium]